VDICNSLKFLILHKFLANVPLSKQKTDPTETDYREAPPKIILRKIREEF
jgi:hypothetical protein